MRKFIGWALIIWPAGIILQQLLGMVVNAVSGQYANGGVGEHLAFLAMGSVLALLPIGLGVLLVRGPRARPATNADPLPPRRRSTRELVGWALTLPGALAALTLVANLTGARDSGGLAGFVQLVVVSVFAAIGVWLIVAERRHARSVRDHLTESR